MDKKSKNMKQIKQMIEEKETHFAERAEVIEATMIWINEKVGEILQKLHKVNAEDSSAENKINKLNKEAAFWQIKANFEMREMQKLGREMHGFYLKQINLGNMTEEDFDQHNDEN